LQAHGSLFSAPANNENQYESFSSATAAQRNLRRNLRRSAGV
jgi:hypothetical protein